MPFEWLIASSTSQKDCSLDSLSDVAFDVMMNSLTDSLLHLVQAEQNVISGQPQQLV